MYVPRCQARRIGQDGVLTAAATGRHVLLVLDCLDRQARVQPLMELLYLPSPIDQSGESAPHPHPTTAPLPSHLRRRAAVVLSPV